MEEPIMTYDKWGRMHYNPYYHENYNQRMSEEDKAYLCTFYKRGEIKTIALALGKTDKAVYQMYGHLKKRGKIEYYKRLYEEGEVNE